MSITGKLTIHAKEFLKSPEGLRAHEELVAMVSDDTYNTAPTYSPRSDDGYISFVDKHMTYICAHKDINVTQYVSNLRLLTRVS